MLHLLRINVWPLSCEAATVFLHSEAVAEIHIWSIVRSEDQYNYKKTDLVKNQIKAQFCSHCLNLVPSSHRLARNEAEVWCRRGSPGPGKPARWRWRRRIGLALPLWPLPVWRQLPLQVPPKLERRTWWPGGGRGAGTWGGGEISGGFTEKSSSVLVLRLGHSFVGYLKLLIFNTVKNDHKDLTVATEWTRRCRTKMKSRLNTP